MNISYEDVKDKLEILKAAELKAEDLKRSYLDTVKAYRIAYVQNVLDFIRSQYRSGKVVDLEILLCHCQNKLYGNLDSTELDLEHFKDSAIDIDRKRIQIVDDKHLVQNIVSFTNHILNELSDYVDEDLNYRVTVFRIVQDCLLVGTDHSGGTSTRAKCKEIDLDDDYEILLGRISEDEDSGYDEED